MARYEVGCTDRDDSVEVDNTPNRLSWGPVLGFTFCCSQCHQSPRGAAPHGPGPLDTVPGERSDSVGSISRVGSGLGGWCFALRPSGVFHTPGSQVFFAGGLT